MLPPPPLPSPTPPLPPAAPTVARPPRRAHPTTSDSHTRASRLTRALRWWNPPTPPPAASPPQHPHRLTASPPHHPSVSAGTPFAPGTQMTSDLRLRIEAPMLTGTEKIAVQGGLLAVGCWLLAFIW